MAKITRFVKAVLFQKVRQIIQRRLGVGLFLCLAFILIAMLVLGWLTWPHLKMFLALEPAKKGVEIADYFAIIRNFALILAAVIGLPFLIWRSWLADQAQKTAAKNQRNALFENAIKHLEGKKGENLNTFAILGGVETLRQLAADNPDIEGRRVRTFLAHYLRLHYPYDPKSSDNAELSSEKVMIRNEALRAFAGNFKAVNLQKINIERADIEGANLEGANLQGTNLQGADLQEAILLRADLQGADLQGADLRDANLLEADLEGADLQKAYLNEADLRRAYLGGANLQGANFRGADVAGAFFFKEGFNPDWLEGAKNIDKIKLID